MSKDRHPASARCRSLAYPPPHSIGSQLKSFPHQASSSLVHVNGAASSSSASRVAILTAARRALRNTRWLTLLINNMQRTDSGDMREHLGALQVRTMDQVTGEEWRVRGLIGSRIFPLLLSGSPWGLIGSLTRTGVFPRSFVSRHRNPNIFSYLCFLLFFPFSSRTDHSILSSLQPNHPRGNPVYFHGIRT